MIKFSGEKKEICSDVTEKSKFCVLSLWKCFIIEKNEFYIPRKKFIILYINLIHFFNPFDSQNILSDENNGPNINFFNKKFEAVKPPYYNVDKFHSSSQYLLKNSFYVLHINIRSMKKVFEKLREYLPHAKGNFGIIALTET